MTWYTGTFAASVALYPILPVAISPNLIFGFARAEAGTTVDLFTSETQGRTWQKKQTLDFSGQTWAAVHFAVHLSPGWFLLGGNCAAAVTPGCTGLGIFNISGASAQVALPGLTAGLAGGMATIYQRGTTVVGTWVRSADSTSRLCRSTDSGITWTCAGVAFDTLPLVNGKGMDSPTTLTWLRGAISGTQRSVDDGATWASVMAPVVGSTLQVVECVSATVCLYTDGQNHIYRSTDTGLTWALSFTAPGGINPNWSGFVDYGNGVVALVPAAITRNVWLSRDYGATWAPTFRLAGNTQRCIAPCQTTTAQGIGIWTAGGAVNTEKVVYSPAIGVGTSVIVGTSGAALDIDAAGMITVKQGTGNGSNLWTTYLTDSVGGPNRIATPYTIGTSPIEGPTLLNSQSVSAANTAITITLAGAAGTRVHLYAMAGYCSAGSAIIQAMDGAAALWTAPAGTVGTMPYTVTWPVGLTGTTGGTMTATLGSCGVGNVGTLSVQADRF
jgi:hypothetical protein